MAERKNAQSWGDRGPRRVHIRLPLPPQLRVAPGEGRASQRSAPRCWRFQRARSQQAFAVLRGGGTGGAALPDGCQPLCGAAPALRCGQAAATRLSCRVSHPSPRLSVVPFWLLLLAIYRGGRQQKLLGGRAATPPPLSSNNTLAPLSSGAHVSKRSTRTRAGHVGGGLFLADKSPPAFPGTRRHMGPGLPDIREYTLLSFSCGRVIGD